MSFIDFFRRPQKTNSAAQAKERLQIVLTHSRGHADSQPDYLPALRKELLEVISRHAGIDLDKLSIKLDNNAEKEVLEVNVTLPRRS